MKYMLHPKLKAEVRFDEYHVTSVDWETYPILKFWEAPEMEIVLLNRPDQPALRAGKLAQVTTAALWQTPSSTRPALALGRSRLHPHA